MAQRKSQSRKTQTKKRPARKTARKRAAAKRAPSAVARLEQELPETLAQFSRHVRTRLTRLEREIQRSEASRRFTRLLRDASHQLGQWEAEGERRWRKLSTSARRDAAGLLRRLERAIEPPKPRRKGNPGKATRPRATESRGSGI
jgi:hypothetical protein